MPRAKVQPAVQATAKAQPVAKTTAKNLAGGKGARAVQPPKAAKPAGKVQATPKVASKSKGLSQTTQKSAKSTKSQKVAKAPTKRASAAKQILASIPIKEASKNIKKDTKSKPPTKPPSPKKEDSRPSAQPKKPGSAYLFFNSEMQSQMKSMEKFKALSFGERTKVVSESWGKLDEGNKAEYVKKSEDDKKRYEKELKQLEKKGFFKDKDGKDSRDLYKPAKEKKSGEGEAGTQKSKSPSPAKKKDDKEKEKAKKEKERERAKKLKEKEKAIAKKLKEKELKQKKKELLLDDRAKPKNVMTLFMHFAQENGKKYPEITQMCEVIKRTSADWKLLTDEQKKKYEPLIEKDRIRFERETKEFNEQGFFTNSNGIKSTFLAKKTHKVMEFERGTVMPRKARPSWMIFNYELHMILKGQVPEGEKYNPFNHFKEIGEKWRSMTEQEKEKYEKLQEKDQVRFENQMAALRMDGFFTNEDGVKSTDLPPRVFKPRRTKRNRTTKSTVVEEEVLPAE